MAASPETNKSLREALYDTLMGILSPHQEVRTAAEDRIQALEVTEEFGVHLTEFIVEKNLNIAIRQLSSVLLKQYVEEHWCHLSEKFRCPETPEKAKAVIRHALPEGLKEPCSKVHGAVAYAVAAIAQWDWPEKWPELFELLISYLSGDDWAVHGAMKVLNEFANDLSDSQLPQIAPIMLSEMYRIFSDEQRYNTRTRSRAVRIFSNCTYMICATSEYHKGLSKSLLQPVLPLYINKFTETLQTDYGPFVDPGLKADVIKAITFLVQHLPKQMAPCMPQILPPIWQTLIQAADVYKSDYVTCSDFKEEPVDSDGECIGFDAVIFSTFELIDMLTDISMFTDTVKAALADLIYYLILFTQITDEQAKRWTEKPERYIDEEDEHTYTFSVRILAKDLLRSIFEEFEAKSIGALSHAMTKHLQALETERNTDSSSWWKSHEACMCALEVAHETVMEQLEHGEELHFDFSGFLQNVVVADMNQTGSPYLLGRCLCVGSSYAKLMSPTLLEQFLQATVNGLQANQAHQIRISAVRAVYGFCTHLKNSQNINCLKAVLPAVMDGLLVMVNQYTTEFLCLVLETISTVLSIDPVFTVSCCGKIISLAIAVFLKYNSDHSIVNVALDILRELSMSPDSLVKLEQRFVPTLVSILNAPQEKIVAGLAANALDALQTIVRNSKPPLSDALINTAFPAAAQCILKTSDHSIMQNGGECLRAYVSVSPDQVFNYQDADGQTGLGYLLQTAAVLLNPASTEFTATSVGKFVVTLISKAGNILGENLDLILKAVLSKMQRAESITVIQSLIMVYAQLIHHQLEPVLNFLSSVPGPTGQSALHYVLEEWSYRHSYFCGDYEVKVSALALCKILEYGVSHNDDRLNSIIVKGDQIYVQNDSGGVKTRSQAQNNFNEWTSVPLLVKIFKILLNEVSNVMESKAARTEIDEETDEEWEDDSGFEQGGSEDKQSQSFEDSSPDGPEDSDCDDPDILNDPLYRVDLTRHLAGILISLGHQPYFHVFSQHLNENELKILKSVSTSP
ncbi:importin-9 isoform X3 [Schistocerca gregaria]|nr:importin-9 isoform X3 [Schistocerca gregaria]